jgi:hypothetical protein
MSSWEIVKSLHHVVLTATKEAIMVLSFLSLYVDDVTIVNNQLCSCRLETCACIVYT